MKTQEETDGKIDRFSQLFPKRQISLTNDNPCFTMDHAELHLLHLINQKTLLP